MAKYFISRDKNTSAHKVSDGGMARQDPFYQQSREVNSIYKAREKASQWQAAYKQLVDDTDKLVRDTKSRFSNSADFDIFEDFNNDEKFSIKDVTLKQKQPQPQPLREGDPDYRGDSKEWLEQVAGRKDSLESQRKELENQLETYGKYWYSDDNRKEVESALASLSDVYNAAYSAALEDDKVWSQFADESEYREAQKKYKEYNRLLNMDIDAKKAEKAQVKADGERAKQLYHELFTVDESLIDKFESGDLEEYPESNGYGGIVGEEITEEGRRKRAELDNLLIKYRWNKDTLNDDITASIVPYNLDIRTANIYQVQNHAAELASVDDSLFYDAKVALGMDIIKNSKYNKWDVSYMKDDEVKTLAYILGDAAMEEHNAFADEARRTGEKYVYNGEDIYATNPDWEKIKVAREYLDSYEEIKNSRWAAEQFKNLEGNTGLELLFSLGAGLNQFGEGVANLFNGEDYIAPSGMSMLSQMVREDVQDDWKIGDWSVSQTLYDVGNTTANMMPTILASTAISYVTKNPTLGAAVGSGIQGMSAAGNAYAEMLNLGYDKEQAAAYGTLTGTSEAVMQYALGGISKLGGKLTGKAASKLIGGVNHAAARVAINTGMNMLSEFTEESLQEVLTPFFKRVAGMTEEDAGSVDLGEVMYAGLLGALSAGILETGGNIRTEINTYKLGKNIIKTDNAIAGVKKLGSMADAKSVAYKLAGQLSDNASAYQVGRAFMEIGANLSESTIAELENNLVDKGVASRDAKVLVKALNGIMNGAELTDSQIKAIESNDVLTRSVREVLLQAKAYRDITYSVYEKLAKDKADSKSENLDKESNKIATANVDAAEKASEGAVTHAVESAQTKSASGVVSEVKVSAENSAVSRENPKGVAAKRLSDSKTVGVVGVEHSDAEGNITYRLNNGEVVEAENIQFDDDFESYVLSDVAKGFETDSANAIVRAAAEYKEYSKNNGAMASSQKLRSSFNDLRAAGLKGVTYEQAARDIKLSGDIRQIGESAARIAINDGLYMAEGVSRTKAKPSAKTVAKAESKNTSADKPQNTHKSAIRAVKGSVVVAPDVKVAEGMKGDIEVLNRIAEVGDVAVVIEKFEGADKDAKGFYSKGVIHLNADKLSEGGFTYTGIHESVHYLAEVNPEGYAAIEKFLRNYYKQQGVDLESEIKLTKALYSERGVELTKEEAMEEIVCNTLSDIATDKKALSAFLNLSKKEQKSFIGFIKDLAKKLKAWADKNLKGSKYHSVIINDAKTLRELAEMFNTEISKSAQKNNTAESGGVKYSHKINTDYSDLSKLDAESLKVYNDRGWAQQLLRAEDWVLYNQHVGYKLPKGSKYFKSELSDGSLVLEINNKVLIVSGQYGRDEIYGILAINAPSEGHASWIKEALYNDTEGLWLNKESYGEVCESLQDVFGERVVRYYNGADYSYRKGQYHSKQRATLPSYWENFGYTKDKQNGGGISGNAQKGVSGAIPKVTNKKSYSFGEEDLDFGLYLSEDSEVAENLKESGRAVGAIFEKTKGAEVDIFDVSKVMKKNLRDFGIKGETVDANERILEVIELASAESYVDGGAVVGEVAAVMKDTLRNSPYVVDNFKEEREDILSRMKGFGKIYLSEDQIAMLEDSDYSLNRFKQKMFGKITVVNKPKTAGNVESLNTLWHSLSEAYPEWFSAETLSDNMPMEMLRVMDELKPQSVGAEEFFMQSNDEIAIELASRVVSDIVDVKYRKLQDNKVKSEVKKLKEKQSENMKKWLLKKDAGEKLKSIERMFNELYKKVTIPTKTQSIPEDFRMLTAQLLTRLGLAKGKIDNRATKRVKNSQGQWETVPNERQGMPILHDVKVEWKTQKMKDELSDGKVDKMAELNFLLDEETQKFAPGSFNEYMNKIASELEKRANLAPSEENVLAYGMDIDARLIEDMREFAETVRTVNVYEMTDNEINKLHSIMFRYKNALSSAGKLHTNKLATSVEALGQRSIAEFREGTTAKWFNRYIRNSKSAAYMYYNSADAYTYFSGQGEACMSVYDSLRSGIDVAWNDLRVIGKDIEIMFKNVPYQKWAKEYRNITLNSGEVINLSVAEIINVYNLNKREQARGHLYNNAVETGEIVTNDKQNSLGKLLHNELNLKYQITEKDINKIISELNDKQIDIADKMFEYMPKLAELGNEVTMKKYLYKGFIERNYWPIETYGGARNVREATKIIGFYTAANPGFSKHTQEKAHKPLVIRSAFDVFAEHASEMAIYHGMAIPLTDAMKWYNYSAGGTDNVHEAMKVAFSHNSNKWFENFIIDLNGMGPKSDANTQAIDKLIQLAKSNATWNNLRTVVVQGTAYFRAFAILGPELINQKQVWKKVNPEEVAKYCPVYGFKSEGHYFTDTGKSLSDMVLDRASNFEKFKRSGFSLAGYADEKTLNRLWNACATRVLKDNPKIKAKSEEHKVLTGKLLSRVIDETQVVDSPFHRSQARRSKGTFAKAFFAFSDEPTKSWNMLVRAFRSGDMKRIARTSSTILVSTIFTAFMRALFDFVFRHNPDEDEDKETHVNDFFEMWIKNVIDENVLTYNPYLSKLWPYAETAITYAWEDAPEWLFDASNNTGTLETKVFSDIVTAVNKLSELGDEDSKLTPYGVIYYVRRAVSSALGVNLNAASEFVVNAWNTWSPSSMKITKIENSNTAVAELAVDALLKGNKGDYDMWYKELEERFKGDKDKIQSKLATALGKSSDKRVSAMLDAMESGDKETIDAMYDELEGLGFDNDVIVKGTKSYKAKYESYVNKAAQANIDGDAEAYDEAIAWIKEQGVFDEVYLDDIAEKEEKLCADQSSDDVEELYDNTVMVKALKNYGEQYFNEMLSERLEGKSDAEKEKTRSSLKTAVSKEFKLSFCEAFCSENAEEVEKIEGYLISSGLYADDSDSLWKDTTKDWVRDYIEVLYKSAYSLEDVEECARLINLLYKSGVYASDENAKAALERWRNEEK